MTTVLEVGANGGSRRLASGMHALTDFTEETPNPRNVYATIAEMARPAPR